MPRESDGWLRRTLRRPSLTANARSRVRAVLSAVEPRRADGLDLRDAAGIVETFRDAEHWLLLAVAHAELPLPSAVRRLRRVAALDGGAAALRLVMKTMPSRRSGWAVDIISDSAIVDVSGLLPGGRGAEGRGVGRQLLRAWATERDVIPVTWTSDRRAMRELDPSEYDALRLPTPAVSPRTCLLVPHRSRFVMLGTVDLPRAAERLIALGQYSENETASVGYGLGPLLRPDDYSRQRGGEARFSWHLAAARTFHRLVALGADTEREYRGWKQMLSAIGVDGPVVTTMPLPNLSGRADDGATGQIDAVAWADLAREVGLAVGIGAPTAAS